MYGIWDTWILKTKSKFCFLVCVRKCLFTIKIISFKQMAII